MFLTESELIELTLKRRRSSQSQVLKFMGIEHRVRPDGSIAVLREHVNRSLGGLEMLDTITQQKSTLQPNWGAL